MSDDKTITISVELYEELVTAQNFLLGLKDCGIDNWLASYGEAQEMSDD